MNRPFSSKNGEIEARLERSLRRQIRAPQLDGRFDAAVWARIDRARESAGVPLARERSTASRWLFASNVIGLIIAIALVAFFGAQTLSGVEVNVAVPEVPPGFVERIVSAIIWPVTAVAVGFGMMFTSLGRKLRAELF